MRALKLAFPYILAVAWMGMTAFALAHFAEFASSTERYRARTAPTSISVPAGRDAATPRPLRNAR
jgi:hypothetical protein